LAALFKDSSSVDRTVTGAENALKQKNENKVAVKIFFFESSF